MSEKEYYLLTSDAWVPESVTLTGTFSSSGKIVTGSGTTFLSEIQGGDWLINTTTKEAAMVRTIDTDVRLELYKGFTNASGEDVVVVKKDKAKVIYARIKNASGADITIDGQTLPDTDSIEEGKSNKAGFRFKFIKPKYITTTGNTIVNLDHFGTPPQAKQQFIGLIDEYPGASVAYSLRQLSSSYTGDAIEVRREPDNAVAQIGFVNNELDTASLLAFANGGNGNAFVARWYDQSGNGNDATQGYAANQPQVVSSGVLDTENLKPTITSASPDEMNFTNLLLSSVTGYFVASVYRNNGGDMIAGDGNTTNSFIWMNNAASVIVRETGTDTNLPITSGNGAQALMLLNRTDGNFEISINTNTQLVTKANDTININQIFDGYSGTSFSLLGNMQEFIIWSSDQSANKTSIQTNLNDFYSIY